jgi:hypothetical protein
VRGRHNRTKGEESESGEGEQVDILSVLARERVAVAVKETLPLGLLLLYTLLLLSRFLQRRVQLLALLLSSHIHLYFKTQATLPPLIFLLAPSSPQWPKHSPPPFLYWPPPRSHLSVFLFCGSCCSHDTILSCQAPRGGGGGGGE